MYYSTSIVDIKQLNGQDLFNAFLHICNTFTHSNANKQRLTVFGAGSEQVDDVEVRTQVTHDLQLGHQSLSLAPPCCGWRGEMERNSQSVNKTAGCLSARLLDDLLAARQSNLATRPNLMWISAHVYVLCVLLHSVSYTSAFSPPPSCWTGSE